jgi:hypothetical protein
MCHADQPWPRNPLELVLNNTCGEPFLFCKKNCMNVNELTSQIQWKRKNVQLVARVFGSVFAVAF